jgi:hypothetical protein
MSGLTLTLFTTMKPFRGEAARIQRNSIKSWLALNPRPEIIVFGDEPGVHEACDEFGLGLVSDVDRAPAGPPYLDDLFAKAQRLARTPMLCYVNADILLTSDLLTAIGTVSRELGLAVMACAPQNVAIPHELQTSHACWEQDLRAHVLAKGSGLTRCADVFVFPAGFYDRLPRLEMGRYYFDNVLLWRACFGDLAAVDLTDGVLIVHQSHGQTSHPTSSGRDPEQTARIRDSGWNQGQTRWWQRHSSRLELPFALRPDGSIVRRSRIPRVVSLGRVTLRQCSVLKFRVLYKTFFIRRRVGLYRWWRREGDLEPLQGAEPDAWDESLKNEPPLVQR